MKKLIICIIGESGTGKSTIASFFTDKGFIQTQSHTERPPRFKGETGHTFHTKESFDKIPKSEMIASTVYGGYRYTTIHDDIDHPCVFVVDEPGLKELLTYSDRYRILTIRVHRKVSGISAERLQRNLDEYTMKDNEFDMVIHNNESLEVIKQKTYNLINKLVIHSEDSINRTP